MLRNCAVAPSGHSAVALLNEVLSLNAQEFDHVAVNRPRIVVLNEVLSLNAQECAAVPSHAFSKFPQ